MDEQGAVEKWILETEAEVNRCQGSVRQREKGKATLAEGTAGVKACNHEHPLCMQGGQHGLEMGLKRKLRGGHERNLDLILSAGGDERNMLIFSNS